MNETLKVSGMHCRSCEMLLQDVINDVKGAKAVSLDFKSGKAVVSVESQAALADVKKAIKGEGYGV